jgi:hypothetical protein
LTQGPSLAGSGMGLALNRGGKAEVKVIETKTVGAYAVSILAAGDAGSLERWIKEHGYAMPSGKGAQEIVDDYIRRGWFFVAAKIDLVGGNGFKVVASKEESTTAVQKTKSAIKTELASGELHPLLISFDTPQCIFPLKISSVAGKASQVSLYVISEKALINGFVFEANRKELEKEYQDWENGRSGAPLRELQMIENMRVMDLQWRLYRGGDSQRTPLEELQAIAREGMPPSKPKSLLDREFMGRDLFVGMEVKPDQIAAASTSVPRLKGRTWYLAKMNRMFSPTEMLDLEFEDAVPVLGKLLKEPYGGATAKRLAWLGADGAATLIEACRSHDAVTRRNGAIGMAQVKESHRTSAVAAMLKDPDAAVRLYAARSAAAAWDTTFLEPMIELFRDSNSEIREAATESIIMRAAVEAAPKCERLATDSDAMVRLSALRILGRVDPRAVPRGSLGELLRNPDGDIQVATLLGIQPMNRTNLVSRAELLHCLGSARIDILNLTLRLIERDAESRLGPGSWNEMTHSLTSEEAAALSTNRLAEARLLGLHIFKSTADSKAAELTLPLLRDTKGVVRKKAFAVITSIAGENVSESDAGAWENWWKTNGVGRARLGK